MNKLEKKLAKFNKRLDKYNALARKYGWLENHLKIEKIDHEKSSSGSQSWSDHRYILVGGYASCRKNVFVKLFQHLFIMHPKYRRLQKARWDLIFTEYDMNHQRACDEYNEEEMNRDS